MSRRVQKVSELLKQQLSCLIKENLSEEYGLITVTAVDVTADLKEATVHISCLDKNSEKSVLKELAAQARDFQHELGRQLEMKFTPRISFKIDQGLEDINRVEEILKELNNR